MRGLTYLKVGQNELAIHDFDKALKIDPKQVVFYSDRGKAYIELGNYWKAILDYSRAIEIHPRTADRYYDRGHAYQKSGNYLKSIDDYSNAIRLDTKHAQAYLGRGEAYLITGKAIESINDFSKAIEHSQNWAIAYFNRGLSYQRKGYDTLALQDYKSANRIEPDNRKFKEAIQNIESSIDDSKIKPDKKLNIIVQDKSEIKEPSQLFVPITQEKSRQLLLAIEHLPGLGGSIVTPEGINTISTLNEMFDIFNTAYYLLTGGSSIWKPRIFTRTQYQQHVRDIGIPALVDYPAYCCENTSDGLTFIIDGSYSAYKVLGFIAHEAGHARQRTLNPNQGLDHLTLNKRAFYEAEAFAFEAAIIRLIGEYSGINATILPLGTKYDLEPWVENWINSTSIKTDDPYQLHLRGLAVIWGAIIMDPELLDLKSELIQNHILSPESMMKLYDYLIYKKSNEIDNYVDSAIYHFKLNKRQIKKSILSRGGAIPEEGFFEQLYSLFLFP